MVSIDLRLLPKILDRQDFHSKNVTVTASVALCSVKSRQGCGLASLNYLHKKCENILRITNKRNPSSKCILPHSELAVIMQNSNSETTKTRKKGPKLICIKLQIKHLLKFVYSKKATKFCEIFTLLLTTEHTDISKEKISHNFVAFWKFMHELYEHRK